MEEQQLDYAYPPVPIQSSKADLLEKIKPDAIVEVIRHRLMGEDFVNGKWIKIEAFKDKAITALGAWDLSNLMLPASSQNVSISKIDDETIRRRSLAIAKQTQEQLLKNWKEYGIKGTDQLGFIHQIVFTNTFITLKQPENAGIRGLIMGATQENRSIISTEEKKKSWLPFRR